MPSLSFDAATLCFLAACESVARAIWPELFEEPTPASCAAAEDGREGERDGDSHDEMAVW